MMTLEKPLSPDVEFSRLLADGYDSLAVRKANPRHYWAHRQEGEEAHYYWGGEEPGSLAEYVAAVGVNSSASAD